MTAGSTAEGWHVLRGETRAGPYTWEQLYGFAQAGHIVPDDMVWHESLTDWIPAATVPSLFPVPAHQQPAAHPEAAPPAASGHAAGDPTFAPAPRESPSPVGGGPSGGPERPPEPRRRKWVIPLVAVFAVIVVLGGATAGFLLWRGGGDDALGAAGDDGAVSESGDGGMGAASYTPPTSADLVETEAWGRVPINQMGVILLEGKDRGDAEALAEDLGGTVVGEMEFIDLYQLQVPAASEAELSALIDRAAATEGVELAFPNQETLLDEEIWGVRSSPLVDPVYGGENGKGYRMIGVQRAWDIIRGSGRDLSAVQVGVIDDGLYKGQQEFDGASSIVGGESGDELATPTKDKDGKEHTYGSHGTAVTGIIGADPDNGGQSGVASVLGDKLKIANTNIWGPKYGVNTPVAPDPNDPTQHQYVQGTYSLGNLQALLYQVKTLKSKVINCSWGNSDSHPAVAATYKKFFEKMAAEHPDVLFVCSAGNNGKALDGKKRYPSGLNLPNMITVGNLDNDGSKWKSSNTIGEDFEVTLGAPGHRAVSGVDPDTGEVSNEYGGTSFATPQVTATAAMMKSLNPALTAAQIKAILTQTAGPGVTDDEKQMSVPFPHEELGAGVLRTDLAVAKVLYDLKNPSASGKPTDAATLEKFVEELQNQGVIDAVAVSTDDPATYTVRGIVKALPDGKGTDITITLSGQGAISGKTTQRLDTPGEVTWSVTVADESATVTVRRADNGAASVITIETIDLNGYWEGTFTIGSITLPEGARAEAEAEGCDLSVIDEWIGAVMPMTMDITADPGGGGVATVFVDSSGLSEDGEGGEPQTKPIRWNGNSITMDMSNEGATGSLTGRASRQGEADVITGTWSSRSNEIVMTGTWTVTRR